MLILGQLLDALDCNEVVTLKGRKGLVFIEELPLAEAKEQLTREARTLVVEQLYSDVLKSERDVEGSQLVIYVKPNGYFVTNEGEVIK